MQPLVFLAINGTEKKSGESGEVVLTQTLKKRELELKKKGQFLKSNSETCFCSARFSLLLVL